MTPFNAELEYGLE